MKSEVFKRIVDTRDALLSLTVDAAGRINKRDDQARRTTRYFSHMSLQNAFSTNYCELTSIVNQNLLIYKFHIKLKQSSYRPGQAQRVPGS